MLQGGIWIPTQLIYNYCESGDINSLAYYARLKMSFKAPVIYNFTYQRAADILSVSKSTAHTIFKRLERLKLISYKHGHCFLLSNSEAKKRYSNSNGKTHFTPIKRFDKIEDIKTWIQYMRIQSSAKKQKSAINNKKANSFKKHTVSKVPSESPNINEQILLSNRKIGEYFGQSTVSGGKIQKKLNQIGLIESQKNFKRTKLGKITYDMYVHMGLTNQFYFFKGEVYKRLANTINTFDCTV